MASYKYNVNFFDPAPDSEAFFSTVVAPYQAGQLSQLATSEAFFSVQNASEWNVWSDNWESVSTNWEDLR
ncbi:MAG: hypothetical protein EBU96_01155 [Actinobacteria bacterium]|nr:hypothetical protein [Actinomycetota bacterium]